MNVYNSTGAEGLAPWNFNGKLRVKVASLIQYGTKELEKKAVLLSHTKKYDECVQCVSTHTVQNNSHL